MDLNEGMELNEVADPGQLHVYEKTLYIIVVVPYVITLTLRNTLPYTL